MGVFNSGFILIFSGFIFLFGSCNSEPSVERSIYHWETDFAISEEEEAFMEAQNMKRIFVKYFDLKRGGSNEIVPVANVNFMTAPKCEVVPVVYISTGVFIDPLTGSPIDSSKIEKLAQNTYDQIKDLHHSGAISEIQVDCDWMGSIQEAYFYFLTQLKTKMPEDSHLSCTVRLYQYKYPNLTGVPPVDYGVLMYYNMGEFKDYNETNSILNNSIGAAYLGYGEYPLPLDFALPNFSWALLFRYGEFNRIVTHISEAEFRDTNVFDQTSRGYYRVKRDTVINDSYFRFGDEFRYESCTEDDLLKAAQLLKSEKNQVNTTLLFYDLKPTIANESTKIDAVCAAFE